MRSLFVLLLASFFPKAVNSHSLGLLVDSAYGGDSFFLLWVLPFPFWKKCQSLSCCVCVCVTWRHVSHVVIFVFLGSAVCLRAMHRNRRCDSLRHEWWTCYTVLFSDFKSNCRLRFLWGLFQLISCTGIRFLTEQTSRKVSRNFKVGIVPRFEFLRHWSWIQRYGMGSISHAGLQIVYKLCRIWAFFVRVILHQCIYQIVSLYFIVFHWEKSFQLPVVFHVKQGASCASCDVIFCPGCVRPELGDHPFDALCGGWKTAAVIWKTSFPSVNLSFKISKLRDGLKALTSKDQMLSVRQIWTWQDQYFLIRYVSCLNVQISKIIKKSS